MLWRPERLREWALDSPWPFRLALWRPTMPHSFSLGAFFAWCRSFPRHLFLGGESQLAVSGLDPVTGERWSYEEGEDGPPELSAREREVLARVFPAALEQDPTFVRRLVSRFASRS
jgi:hypothetical protein